MENDYSLKKVVFIDDDLSTNQFHEKLSEAINLAKEVEFFESAEKVLEKYSGTENSVEFPDLFLIDLSLPKMDGHDLAAKLRAMDSFQAKNSQVCFLTASKDIRDVVKADNQEFEHYYWKPMDKRKMEQLLREAFNISK